MKQTLLNVFVTFIACVAATRFSQTVQASPGIAGMNCLAFDQAGNLFVTITGNGNAGGGSIAKFTPNGMMNTLFLLPSRADS